MKKILISLAIIGVAAAIAVGATVAYFSDTETSTGNTFTAGSLDLNLDGANVNVVKFTETNLAPGDFGTKTWRVNNVGSLAGYLDLESISYVDDDVTCIEPEAVIEGAGCGGTGTGTGELSANMNVKIFVDANNSGAFDAGEAVIYDGLLSGIATNYNYNLLLAATTGVNYIGLYWEIPTTVTNVIQSDSITFNMTFELGQTTGQ